MKIKSNFVEYQKQEGILQNRAVCIIPARGGSKRIPRKNIKLFHGIPLIAYSIKVALKSNLFDKVIVSTDDEEIAKVAEFFSFGTNDLTQTTLGLSRDDSGSFLPAYVSKDIYDKDPFESIDQSGVGFLMEHAIREGRKSRPKIKLGICGEHGGDPESVVFCHKIGMNYVSCSPFRVPIARLAAAQAALEFPRK